MLFILGVFSTTELKLHFGNLTVARGQMDPLKIPFPAENGGYSIAMLVYQR